MEQILGKKLKKCLMTQVKVFILDMVEELQI